MKYFKRKKNPQPKKSFHFSDALSIVGLIFTIVFGYWGVRLSQLSIIQSKEISDQQQQIKGFDSLLKLTKIEISVLNKQDSILISHLENSQRLLLFQKKDIELNYKHDLAKLMNSENDLNILLTKNHQYKLSEWSFEKRDSFIFIAKNILEKNMTNKFLIQHSKLYSQWVVSYQKFSDYTHNYHFYPKNKEEFNNWQNAYSDTELLNNIKFLNETWRSAYFSIAKLSQDLYNLLNQYRFGKFDFDN